MSFWRSRNGVPARPSDTKPAQVREQGDPHEGMRPLPWFMIMLIGAMTMWGVFYIHDARIDLDSPYGDSRTTRALEPAGNPVANQPGAAATPSDGKQIYTIRCAPCHQSTGAGVPGVFPPLAGSEWVNGSDKILVLIPLHGITGPLTVHGASYNGAMPSFNALPDSDIAAVLTYVRGQWGNQAPAVVAASVKAGRDASKAQTAPWPNGDAIRAQAAP